MKNIELKILGMHCAACSLNVEKLALKLGAKQASVSYTTGLGYFEAEEHFNESLLKKEIEKLGFSFDEGSKSASYALLLCISALLFALPYFLHDFFLLYTASALLSSFCAVFLAPSIFEKAYKAGLAFSMESLIALGSGFCLLYSIFAPLLGHAHLYFFESSFILGIVILGKNLEQKAQQRGLAHLSKLQNYATKSLFLKQGANLYEIKAKDIKRGDLLLAKQGEEVLVDALANEDCWLDESNLTGEFLPVFRKEGEELKAGSIASQSLSYKAKSSWHEGSINSLARALEEAYASKLKLSSLVDKISSIFILIILLISSASFAIHLYLTGLAEAFFYSASVLLISCPCALGLALPLVILRATNLAYEENILLKNPAVLELIDLCRCFVFDKTGTLTKSDLEVKACDLNEADLKLVASIEAQFSHPFAKALGRFYSKELEHLTGLFTQLPNGVKYEKNELVVEIKSQTDRQMDELEVFINDLSRGKISFHAPLKSEASAVFAALEGEKIILSGDKSKAVENAAKELGAAAFFSGISPDAKLEKIKELSQKHKPIFFIGDGLNDAKALAAADISATFAHASKLSQSKSDLVFLDEDLSKIPLFLRLAKRAKRKIKQNLFFSFCYNAFLIPLATGFLPWHLNPSLCVILMCASSLLVVGNSLLLKAN